MKKLLCMFMFLLCLPASLAADSYMDFIEEVHESLLNIPVDFESHYEVDHHPLVKEMLARGEVDPIILTPIKNRYGVMKKIGSSYRVDIFESSAMQKPIRSIIYDGNHFYVKHYSRKYISKTVSLSKVKPSYLFLMTANPYFFLTSVKSMDYMNSPLKVDDNHLLIKAKKPKYTDYHITLSDEKVSLGSEQFPKHLDTTCYANNNPDKIHPPYMKRYSIHSIKFIDPGAAQKIEVDTNGVNKLYDADTEVSIDLR